MSELTTKWPDYNEFVEIAKKLPGPDKGIWIEFEMKRAEAALERLRLAVGFIKEVATCTDYYNYWRRDAEELVKAIGPLPDLPPVQKEG